MQKRVFCLLFISIIFSCSFTSAKRQKHPKAQLIETARARYGAGYKISYNSSKTSALCFAPLVSGEPKRSKDEWASAFFIYDLQKGKILYSESLGRGMVKWRGNTQIEIHYIPGIIKGGENVNDKRSVYLYDIVSAQKRKASVLDNRD